MVVLAPVRSAQDAIEKMKADGVDLSNKDAMARYAREHPDIGKILNHEKSAVDRAGADSQADKKIEQKAAKAESSTPKAADQKKPQTLVQSKL